MKKSPAKKESAIVLIHIQTYDAVKNIKSPCMKVFCSTYDIASETNTEVNSGL